MALRGPQRGAPRREGLWRGRQGARHGATTGKPRGNDGETNGTAIKSGGNGELRVEKMLKEREREILRVETMLSGDLRRFRNNTW